MELDIVSFMQAQRLEAAGFDWGVDFYWADTNPPEICHAVVALGECEFIQAPTTALALKWMRDVKNETFFEICRIGKEWCLKLNSESRYLRFPTYEKLESALLDGLLDYLENDQKIKL